MSYQVAPDEEEFARGAGGYLAYLRREELVAFVEQRDVDAAPVGSGAVDEVVVVCQRGCQIAYCPFALHFGESHDIEARVVYRPCDAGKFRPVAFRVPAIAAGRGEIAVVAERTGDGVEQILDVVEGCRYLSVLGRGILLRQESGSRQEKEKEEMRRSGRNPARSRLVGSAVAGMLSPVLHRPAILSPKYSDFSRNGSGGKTVSDKKVTDGPCSVPSVGGYAKGVSEYPGLCRNFAIVWRMARQGLWWGSPAGWIRRWPPTC